MKTEEEKALEKIRARTSYKQIAADLRWLIENKDKPEEILLKMHPVYSYTKRQSLRWANQESLQQVLKDYKDGKRETQTATGGLGNTVPVL